MYIHMKLKLAFVNSSNSTTGLPRIGIIFVFSMIYTTFTKYMYVHTIRTWVILEWEKLANMVN